LQNLNALAPNSPTWRSIRSSAELAEVGPGDPVAEFGQFCDDVCCAGIAVPGAEPGTWWALGTSARGLDLPAPLLGELQCAAADLMAGSAAGRGTVGPAG
jgi:hypothetical protein